MLTHNLISELIEKGKKQGFMNNYSNDNPRLLEDNTRITRRFEDLFFSPDELLEKYFSKMDVKTMRNDPAYFRKVNLAFIEEGMLRKRDLKDVLNVEINEELILNKKKEIKQKFSKIVQTLILANYPSDELDVMFLYNQSSLTKDQSKLIYLKYFNYFCLLIGLFNLV